MTNSRRVRLALWTNPLVAVLLIAGCGSPTSETLVVFHAASLGGPLREIVTEFEAAHPGTRVLLESSGSLTAARKISDLGRACDVIVSADYTLIDRFLIPDHADWNLIFAGTEMCLAYSEKAGDAPESIEEDWMQWLRRPDVSLSLCDPDSAPCGYRAMQVLRLAERTAGVEGAADTILKRSARYVRPDESEVLALLQSNAVDAVLIYRASALQHDLPYLRLPDEVNLGNPEFEERYASVSAEIAGDTPGSTVTIPGRAILYGITAPNKGANPDAAQAFVTFLLGEDRGGRILSEFGYNLRPPRVSAESVARPDWLELAEQSTSQP